jgi:hypothetical protein
LSTVHPGGTALNSSTSTSVDGPVAVAVKVDALPKQILAVVPGVIVGTEGGVLTVIA